MFLNLVKHKITTHGGGFLASASELHKDGN